MQILAALLEYRPLVNGQTPEDAGEDGCSPATDWFGALSAPHAASVAAAGVHLSLRRL